MPIPFPQVLYDTEPMGMHLVRFTKLKKIMLNIVHMRNAVFKVFWCRSSNSWKKLPDLIAAWSITTMFNKVAKSANFGAN